MGRRWTQHPEDSRSSGVGRQRGWTERESWGPASCRSPRPEALALSGCSTLGSTRSREPRGWGPQPCSTSRKEPGRRRQASAGASVGNQAESPSCPQRGSAQGRGGPAPEQGPWPSLSLWGTAGSAVGPTAAGPAGLGFAPRRPTLGSRAGRRAEGGHRCFRRDPAGRCAVPPLGPGPVGLGWPLALLVRTSSWNPPQPHPMSATD